MDRAIVSDFSSQSQQGGAEYPDLDLVLGRQQGV